MPEPVARRAFVLSLAAAAAATRLRAWTPAAARPVPSPSQLEWQRDELALFLHFGVNTFTNREWGDGTESPSIFAPAKLDARQWARAARAGGFRAMILTAKHHDGFCLWPTKTTEHSVKRSPFRGGSGDVVREFVDACRAESLKPGLYLSPWDRNARVYGDSPRYNDFYCEQLTELLTQYGPIHEVWFDGANGEGPNGKKQEYDWPRVWGLVRQLQPGAVMFSDAGPDVRWIGNERGIAGDPNWSPVDPDVVRVPGVSGDAVTKMLQHGDPDGRAWRPGESDVSIRPGWFYHPAEDAKVRSIDNLVDLYFSSVGRNSKLLLNVPPTPDGLLHDTDVSRLAGMRAALDGLFVNEVTRGRDARWQASEATSGTLTVDLGRDSPVTILDLREDITQGQRVAHYRVEARLHPSDPWQPLSTGTTIGHRRLERVQVPLLREMRVIVEEALDAPHVSLRAYAPR
ncbi:MAG TPA: alpha-L-fucosidase [Vicinamibacterales bacterium]|nr:alpha-L-fucosidase [Vicinamibacterales bacterium]